MASIAISQWWKAKEIPLIETNWRNIRIYCDQDKDPFDWKRCLYVVRLAPPLAIAYGDYGEVNSPLIYVGRGVIKNRWASHRSWLLELGHALPGARYEVWVCQPRGRRNADLYKDIEADILIKFRETSGGYLPLRNKRIEGSPRKHDYPKEFLSKIVKADRRYTWSIYPTMGPLLKMYWDGHTNKE